jgi:hypothetical protein
LRVMHAASRAVASTRARHAPCHLSADNHGEFQASTEVLGKHTGMHKANLIHLYCRVRRHSVRGIGMLHIYAYSCLQLISCMPDTRSSPLHDPMIEQHEVTRRHTGTEGLPILTPHTACIKSRAWHADRRGGW